MEPLKISIAKDFSGTPGPRYIWEGPDSGELFRTTVLYPALKEAQRKGVELIINLDGTAGYGTSFLEESFGGLARKDDTNPDPFNEKFILDNIQIISNEEEYWIDIIKGYIQEANNQQYVKSY